MTESIRPVKPWLATVILNRCGHWTPIEKAKECGKLLSDFVRGISI